MCKCKFYDIDLSAKAEGEAMAEVYEAKIGEAMEAYLKGGEYNDGGFEFTFGRNLNI